MCPNAMRGESVRCGKGYSPSTFGIVLHLAARVLSAPQGVVIRWARVE